MKKNFFSKFDWAAFWVATLVAFGVYFYTLGPSVGLEDSGELATASAHLGVPHPPGYPFWTLCTWIFCKMFSFVTYMGHPNPAWAVSCCSAFFGALAAGCTAMLISRSAGDFIFNKKSGSLFSNEDSRTANWLSFAGGVGGALAFAFSPVEWSQSTIVEIYSLNSLFLMLVFLLSYRWMCRPSDKTLWFTAFVFGLGLTNYQVLLFAIVPLGIMICLKNFKLFRDFALYFIPVALTYQVLKIGEMPQANMYMNRDVINKHNAIKMVESCPSTVAIIVALVFAVLAVFLAIYTLKSSSCNIKLKSLDCNVKLKASSCNIMKTFSELKTSAKAQIRGKIGVLFLMLLIMFGVSFALSFVPVLGSIANHLVGAVFGLGLVRVYLKIARGEKILVGNIFYGFKNLWTVVKALFFIDLFTGLWALLLIIPGIIKWHAYSMTFFILAENKGMSVLEAITLSRKMMDGHKMDLFRLLLSFIGWFFLVAITFGIAGIWVLPYCYATMANFYLSVKEDYMANSNRSVKEDYMAKLSSFSEIGFLAFSGLSLLTLFLAGIGVFASDVSWFVDKPDLFTGKMGTADITAPLVNPKIYLFTAFFIIASVIASVYATLKKKNMYLFISGALAFLAIVVATCSVSYADAKGYMGEAFNWNSSRLIFYAIIAALICISLLVKNGLAYSIPVAGFHIALFTLLERGAINGLVHPTSWWFWWPVAWNFVVLALAWLVLPHGRTVALAAFFTQLGVSFYAYMPIVSELRNPPMNWGYPRTWDGFKHAITRGQYEAITMPEFGSLGEFWSQIKLQMSHYFSEVKIQFTDFIALLALLPLSCWKIEFRRAGERRSFNVLWLCAVPVALLAVRAVLTACGVGSSESMHAFDRLLIALMALPALLGVLIIAFRQLLLRPASALYRFIKVQMTEKRRLGLAVSAVLLVDVLVVIVHHAESSKGGCALLYAFLLLLSVAGAAVFFAPRLIAMRTRGSSLPATASFESANLSQHWLLASGACFFMMTLPLILLAQVKGDIQDGFIQKVKFISSHAMIAMWIGYGLVILAAVVFILLKRRGVRAFPLKAAVAFLVAAMILGAGVTPVVQNYTDSELVFKLGGSEQNGHTFGWQFGAYQLDGAKAIRAQITPDEEPLPDPDYPPPMEPYSIFFGGTDPGRFVPTYMIYGANFRPDVYLITQNALADGTYMAVERDLYGDEIWIPSEEDSSIAFQRYADRKGLSSTNGRLQVTGALEVMEINAELARMMHEHDRGRHAFYIEESYAMAWMYPYLSPHGLIMRINADKKPYDAGIARMDRDFWDWYARRLLNDPMYRRDFAAQKSFSKLRASIAGLYRQQGRYFEAADAFREAHLLYPASPEATFRYISEILLPMSRFSVLKELLEYTDRIDPNNKRTVKLHEYLRNVDVVNEIEEKFRKGAQTYDDAYDLADAYYALGRRDEAVKLVSQLVGNLLKLKDEIRLCRAAAILVSAGRIDEAEKILNAYSAVSRNPDTRLLLEWAVMAHYGAPHHRARAHKYFDYAISRDPQTAMTMISQYLSGLPAEKQDCMLWLKLARCQSSANMRDNAVHSLYNAYTINPNLCRMECQRDGVLNGLMNELIKISEQQRR